MASIVSVNGGNPIEQGVPFNIVLSDINANDIAFATIEQNTKIWNLAVTVINDTTIEVTTPSDLPVSSNNTVKVSEFKTARSLRAVAASSDINWVSPAKTSDFSVNLTKDGYYINTTSNPITMETPLTPATNFKVTYMDLAGTFATNNLTIDFNGLKFYGVVQNYVTDSNHEVGTLVYTGSDFGWKFIDVSPNI